MERRSKREKRFVDDSKVSDHHAIIPTEQFVDLTHMTSEERKIYDLVVRRFLAVLYLRQSMSGSSSGVLSDK